MHIRAWAEGEGVCVAVCARARDAEVTSMAMVRSHKAVGKGAQCLMVCRKENPMYIFF